MTRAVIIFLSGEDEAKLTAYAEALADLCDEAMEQQEKKAEIPEGIKWNGIDVIDPDNDEEEPQEAQVDEIIP